MVPLLSDLVLTPLNKMVVQNENIVTFLMLSASFSFLPLFLSAFGVRPHSLLYTPLSYSFTNYTQKITIWASLWSNLWLLLSSSFWLCLLCLFSSSWTNKAPNSCSSLLFLWLGCILKGVSLLWSHSHRLHVSHHVEFWEYRPFTSLQQFPASSSFESTIFTDLFLPLYLELMEVSSTSAASPDDSFLVLSPTYDPPVLDLVAPPSPKSLVGLELRRSTRVSIPPL